MIPILGDVGKAGKWGVKAGKELLEEGAERAAKEGAEMLVDKVTGRLTPEIGEKLKFIFGQATGSIHNIDRSRNMLRQLERIGLADNPNNREYIFKHLSNVLNDPSNIAKLQENGRVIKKSLLMGAQGALKMESIWQNDKLITIILKGGY